MDILSLLWMAAFIATVGLPLLFWFFVTGWIDRCFGRGESD